MSALLAKSAALLGALMMALPLSWCCAAPAGKSAAARDSSPVRVAGCEACRRAEIEWNPAGSLESAGAVPLPARRTGHCCCQRADSVAPEKVQIPSAGSFFTFLPAEAGLTLSPEGERGAEFVASPPAARSVQILQGVWRL